MRSVELHLPPGMETGELPGLIAIPRGRPLEPRAVRRTLERLYLTGRFSDVLVRAERPEEGLTIVVEVRPRRAIATLSVVGNRALDEATVRRASGLEPGDELYAERLRRAVQGVEALYREQGYLDVDVTSDAAELDGGLDVLLTIQEGLPLPLSSLEFSGDPGLSPRRLRALMGEPVGKRFDSAALERGLETLRGVFRKEGFYRARLRAPTVTRGEAGLEVVVPVEAGPRFRFRFHGNRVLPARALRRALQYEGEEPLDRVVADRLERRLERLYQSYGHPHVEVTQRLVEHSSGEAAVLAFDIVEGPRVRVTELEIVGARELEPDVLRRLIEREIVARRPPGFASVGGSGAEEEPTLEQGSLTEIPRPPAPSTVLLEEAYLAATEAMAELYRSRGFLRVSVRLDAIIEDVVSTEARVRFVIDEGTPTRLRSVSIEGLPADVASPPLAGLATGARLRPAALEEVGRRLSTSLSRGGYLFAEVEPEVVLEPEPEAEGLESREAADIRFLVEAGPRVRVGRIIVHGLKRTEEALVYANLGLDAGDVLDAEALFASQRNLVQLGTFRRVGVRIQDPEEREATKDVLIELTERPRWGGEWGGGYFVEDGPRLSLDLAAPNLDGRGTQLAARARINYVGAALFGAGQDYQGIDLVGGRANLSLQQPRFFQLLPFELGSRLDLIAERVHRAAYRFSRVAAVAGADWTATDWLGVSLQYEIEHDRVFLEGQQIDPSDPVLRYDEGNFSLQSLRPALTLDFRDDPARPTRGLVVTAASEITRSFLPATRTVSGVDGEVRIPDWDIFTLRLQGAATGYLPLGEGRVLALSVRGGRILQLGGALPVDPLSGLRRLATIRPKRFYLGGASSLRGFREEGLVPQDVRERIQEDCRELELSAGDCALAQGDVLAEGGELFALFKAELRFPALGALELGLFFEAGNVWQRMEDFDGLDTLRPVVGAGLRYATPIGPVALDLGLNLTPDPWIGEPPFGVHFSIGLF